jgi:cobalamin-dependent methionine synthase I
VLARFPFESDKYADCLSQLFRLLDPARINISLAEEFQIVPEQSASASIVHHPGAKYFNLKPA